jgi:putative transposase
MIAKAHSLLITRQAKLLGLSRSNVYYLPRPVSEADLVRIRRIDALHFNFPFAGSRMLRDLLRLEGCTIGRKHVASLIRSMAIKVLYRRKNTSREHLSYPVFPYLLRGLSITSPHQAGARDATYVPTSHGFVYPAASSIG